MFFAIIGAGVFIYGAVYTLISLISDCDLELWFYEKFGKSPSKYLDYTIDYINDYTIYIILYKCLLVVYYLHNK